MELDDLRRQWRQPEPVEAAPALNVAALTQLAVQQSGSIVAKLRRNARLELGINYALLAASLAVAGWASADWLRLFCGLLAVVASVCIYYFYRKLGLLRSMDDPSSNLRAHLLRITQGLRALIRFYYRFTLAMIPVALLFDGLLVLTEFPRHLTPLKIGLLWGGLLVLGGALYLPVGRVTTWYLQKLYGQHLDRLEGQLHELNDNEAAHPSLT